MTVINGVVPEGQNLTSSQKAAVQLSKKALFGFVFKNYSNFCSPSDPGFQIQFWLPFSLLYSFNSLSPTVLPN